MEKRPAYFKKDASRLQTTDELGNRVYIHPEDLAGKWKTRRLAVYWALILAYLVLPWIYVDGQQWVLLDIAKREFRIFGNVFLGHDVPYLLFVLLIFAFLIAIVTMVWGRVWCGWACPQTVFLDTIFRKVEGFVEGNSRQQRELDEAPWTRSKLVKRSLKWALFTVISLHITHSFLGYFVGTHRLLKISLHTPLENWPLFIAMLSITGVVLFDFGWFREQFCIIMCPYGRFQSVLMDENSLVVAYDVARGEPRKQPHDDAAKRGDCVSCYQCVRVCPTGIDIRQGSQLECIACTACIDACDAIMLKIDKPPGLIRYATENELNKKKPDRFRPRLIIYSTVLIALIATAFVLLRSKDDLRLLIQRPKSPFEIVETAGGRPTVIMNRLKLEFYVQSEKGLRLRFEIDPALVARGGEISAPEAPYEIKRSGRSVTHVFVKFPPEVLKSGSADATLRVFEETEDKSLKLLIEKTFQLVGPFES